MQPTQHQQSPSRLRSAGASVARGMGRFASDPYGYTKWGLEAVTSAPGLAMGKATELIHGCEKERRPALFLARDIKALTRFAKKVHKFEEHRVEYQSEVVWGKGAANIALMVVGALTSAGVALVFIPLVVDMVLRLVGWETDEPNYDHERAYMGLDTSVMNATGAVATTLGDSLAAVYGTGLPAVVTKAVDIIRTAYGSMSDLDATMSLEMVKKGLIGKQQEMKDEKMKEYRAEIVSRRNALDKEMADAKAAGIIDDNEEFSFTGSKTRFLPKLNKNFGVKKETIRELNEGLTRAINAVVP